jgi:uncharacterized paraquat-inducible protein A
MRFGKPIISFWKFAAIIVTIVLLILLFNFSELQEAGVSFLFFLDAVEKWWEGLLYLVPLGISLILITELFIIQVDKNYFLYKQTEEKL